MGTTERERATKALMHLLHGVTYTSSVDGRERRLMAHHRQAIAGFLWTEREKVLDALAARLEGEEEEVEFVTRREDAERAMGGAVVDAELFGPGSGGYQRWKHDTNGGREDFVAIVRRREGEDVD